MKTNDLITHFMAYADEKSGKVRPLYVIKATEDKVLVFKISSQYEKKPAHIKQRYFPINDWKSAGLLKMSYIDTYSGSRWLPLDQLMPIIGHLTDDDVLRLQAFIARTSLDY